MKSSGLIILSILLGVLAVSFIFIEQIESLVSSISFEISPSAFLGGSLTYYDINQKIDDARDILHGINLKVGNQNIKYTEKRIIVDNGSIRVADREFEDYEREIALVIMNKNTGELSLVIVKKHGADLIVPEGYKIDIVERANGIRWNYWATQYKVDEPRNSMVLMNKWPEKDARLGIEYITYAPYSEDYHIKEVIKEGDEYIKNIVDLAFNSLREKKVYSLTYPNELVADVDVLKKDFFYKIPIIEHSDFGEFSLDPEKTSDRVKIIIGANKEAAFTHTCNFVSACGWVQFTPRTYKELDRIYSRADLINDFEEGAADHLNSMMAAILLYDYNLSNLIKIHGDNIVKDSNLEEYLAAQYNSSPARVNASIKEYFREGWTDWFGDLLPETIGYLAKIRFLQKYD